MTDYDSHLKDYLGDVFLALDNKSYLDSDKEREKFTELLTTVFFATTDRDTTIVFKFLLVRL